MSIVKRLSISIILFVLLFGLHYQITAQSNCSSCHLFKVERSLDADEIRYELNLDSSGRLNTVNPITIYWVRKSQNDITEPLTWIQNSYGYGIEYIEKNINEESYSFRFVSYEDRSFQLKKDSYGSYKVYTNSGDLLVEVSSIFIQIDGGTFWLPEVTRVELHGKEVSSGELIAEFITP